MNRKPASGIAKGAKAMAARMVQGDLDFIEVLMNQGGLSRGDAERAYAYYRKHKLVRMDAVNGTVRVKHGAYLDREAIRRAVNL